MQVDFTPAKPTDSRALIGIAGPQGSGKTASALRLASGITKLTGGDILYVDTENRRALKYADSFNFKHFDFQPNFSADRYLEILLVADRGAKRGSVIIIDSLSHEHEGVGGALEQHEAFLTKRAGDDYAKRERLNMAGWILPKSARNKLIQSGLQRVNSYVILCFRAKEKVKPMKVPDADKPGKMKTEIVNLGWQIIGGDEFGYEVDVMFVLPPGSQGRPDWNEGSARINDMKGDLIRVLKSIPQIDEAMGEKIKSFFSARPAASDIEPLKKAGETEAKKGSEALKAWWTGIGWAVQKQLGTAYLDEMKAIAAKNDAPPPTVATHTVADNADPEDGMQL